MSFICQNMQTVKVILSLCMFALLTLTPEAVVNPCEHNCSQSCYPPNSVYEKNLNKVLKSLSANTDIKDKFYNTSLGDSDAVHGGFLCRGDITPDRCKECVRNASVLVKEKCRKSKASIIWYNECMLRYSNRNFFGVFEKEPLLSSFNPDNIDSRPERFKAVLREMMNALVVEAAKKGYAHREAKFASNKDDLRTWAQCRPDLSDDDCRQCLHLVANKAQNLEEGRQGGRVMLPGCFVRFEIYLFYTISKQGKWRHPWRNTSSIVPGGAVFLLASMVLAYCLYFKGRVTKRQIILKRLSRSSADFSELEHLQFDLTTIRAATNNFSDENKLGQGGFGPVYKGELPNGQQIAAKRLAQNSEQGVVEFRNEIQLVAKLQHKNLVRLLGFSLEGEETILIYEHMPNGSLDRILFAPELSKQLDWSTRYKIIVGIARGLLYLHKDSRLTVIHRDIKASNILLDHEMNPKISDFGMARMFCAHQTKASTKRIAGTFGYMSPEYLMFGRFSMKSDVFSYGVLLLEIITGKKNNKFYSREQDPDLLGHVWRHWDNGTLLGIVDPSIGNAYSVNEVIRCIQIGLLCVQEDMEERPTMDAVIVMLSISDSISLPLPRQPFLVYHGNKTLTRSPRSATTDLSATYSF